MCIPYSFGILAAMGSDRIIFIFLGPTRISEVYRKQFKLSFSLSL